MQKFNALGNIQLGKDYILFSLNPKIYPLPIITSAAFEFNKKACVILDGDPASEILVELRPLDLADMTEKKQQQLILEFNTLLLKKANT